MSFKLELAVVFIVLAVVVRVEGFGYPDCEGYLTLENETHCGDDGYFVAYGLKYCRRFFTPKYYNWFNAKGKAWVHNTGACLLTAATTTVDKAVAENNVNCTGMQVTIFRRHVDCYIDNGFCNICGSNLLAILHVFDLKDFFAPLSQQQVWDVAKQCGIKCLLPF